MDYDAETIRKVRDALTQSEGALYRMMPTDDGGESYEMQCTICGALGNVLARKFVHADNCPVPIEEARLREGK